MKAVAGQVVESTAARACFPAGTPVHAAAGLVAIEFVRPGDLVLSRDEHTGEQTLKRVVRTIVHEASELMHLRTAGDTITATPNHPFRVAGRGWVQAGDLATGDTLCLADGGRTSVVSVIREKLSSPVDVYNLEVADFHTYFVASAGAWVHNCGGMAPRVGTKLYRVWGGESGPYGESWTHVDPRTVSNFRNAAGLPEQNTGRFVSEGVLRSREGVYCRSASRIGSNRGGLPETVVPNAAGQVELLRVSGANPEF